MSDPQLAVLAPHCCIPAARSPCAAEELAARVAPIVEAALEQLQLQPQQQVNSRL